MFFNDNKSENKNELDKVAALLIHAAKIDENYSIIEDKIIRESLLVIGADSKNIDKILENGKAIEENSNQI